jgi:hypothetical protein
MSKLFWISVLFFGVLLVTGLGWFWSALLTLFLVLFSV